jgi:hypothetical protein
VSDVFLYNRIIYSFLVQSLEMASESYVGYKIKDGSITFDQPMRKFSIKSLKDMVGKYVRHEKEREKKRLLKIELEEFRNETREERMERYMKNNEWIKFRFDSQYMTVNDIRSINDGEIRCRNPECYYKNSSKLFEYTHSYRFKGSRNKILCDVCFNE